jgi:hypothetical protein
MCKFCETLGFMWDVPLKSLGQKSAVYIQLIQIGYKDFREIESHRLCGDYVPNYCPECGKKIDQSGDLVFGMPKEFK